MIRVFNILAVVLVIVAGISLYRLKYDTLQLQQQANALREQVQNDRSEIKVLGAEWAYLSSPERLQELANRFLALKPASPNQVLLTVSNIAMRPADAGMPVLADEFHAPQPELRPNIRPATRPRMVAQTDEGRDDAPEVADVPPHDVSRNIRRISRQEAKNRILPQKVAESKSGREPFNPLTDKLRLVASGGGRP